MTYQWLDKNTSNTWAFIGRVLLKTLILFAACNLIFALVFPIQWLGNLTLHNGLLEGRTRFSYGEVPRIDNSVITSNLPALFASHEISQAKADDEYRVIVLGDSATWGWFLDEDETLSALLTQANYAVDDKQATVYNLAYPQGSVVKDLLVLSEAMQYEPDAVLWMVSMTALEQSRRTDVPLLEDNAVFVNQLAEEYDLDIELPENDKSFWERSIIGQRIELSNLLQLQTYGFTYAATGIDQNIPDEYPLVRNDIRDNDACFGYDTSAPLEATDYSFDVVNAADELLGDNPLIMINQPIFISDGQNSDVCYNSLYPKAAYDQYREIFAEQAEGAGWYFSDVWNLIPSERFTNSPLHYDVEGAEMLADEVGQVLRDAIRGE